MQRHEPVPGRDHNKHLIEEGVPPSPSSDLKRIQDGVTRQPLPEMQITELVSHIRCLFSLCSRQWHSHLHLQEAKAQPDRTRPK